MQGRLDVDSIINQMINSGGRNVKIREKDISLLCKITREIFMEQPVFLELEAPIKICGKSPSLFIAEERSVAILQSYRPHCKRGSHTCTFFVPVTDTHICPKTIDLPHHLLLGRG